MTNLQKIAEGEQYYLTTSMEQCLLGRFWVMQLDANFEVYQTHDDGSLAEANPWLRLKQFCEDHNIKPINMAFASQDLNHDEKINLDPHADAYFYARRSRKLMSGNPHHAGYEDHAQGVGQLHKDHLKIIWEFSDGGMDFEERDLSENPKSNLISLIRK